MLLLKVPCNLKIKDSKNYKRGTYNRNQRVHYLGLSLGPYKTSIPIKQVWRNILGKNVINVKSSKKYGKKCVYEG